MIAKVRKHMTRPRFLQSRFPGLPPRPGFYARWDIKGLTSLMQILFVSALIVVTYKSIAPAQSSVMINHWDKVLHVSAYAILTGLAGLAFPRWPLMGIALFVALFGAGLEVAQGLMHFGRTGSLWDLAANVAGIGLVIGVWAILCHKVS